MAHPQIIMKDTDALPVSMELSEIIDPYEMNTVAIEHIGDKTVYRYRQTVGDILNNNERERQECIHDSSSEFRKTASVPMVVWQLWENMGITGDQKELRRALQRHREEYMTTNKQII